jgi:hypothetical protein
MPRITATTLVCECCGQPIRKAPAARKSAASFRGYDDFVPAFNAARHAAIAALGQRWYMVPGASQWARIPAPWAACKVYGRTSTAPRDRRLPAAVFWPSGALPVGPEYASDGPRETAPRAWGDPRRGAQSNEGYGAWRAAWAERNGFVPVREAA